MATKISLDELVLAGAHFGHQSRRWNPKIKDYLHGEVDGVHVFDLVKTKARLEEALDFLARATKEGKIILIVGTKKQVKEKIKEVGEATNSPYINERWLGGLVTNFGQIKKSIDKMIDMKAKRETGEFQKYTKKERLLMDREIERLERFFGGLTDLKKLPDIIFIIDIKKEFTALKEANKKGITVVAITDSNTDPTLVDYPIPMNDDATKALEYVLDLVKESLSISPKTKAQKTPESKK